MAEKSRKPAKEALAAVVDGLDVLLGIGKEEKKEEKEERKGEAAPPSPDTFSGLLQSFIPFFILPQLLPLFQQALTQTLSSTTVNVRVESATSIIPIDISATTAIVPIEIRASQVTLNVNITGSQVTLNVNIASSTATLNVSVTNSMLNVNITNPVLLTGQNKPALAFNGVDNRIVIPHSDLLNVQSGNRITIIMRMTPLGWQSGYPVGNVIDKRTEKTANYNWEFNDTVMEVRIHANNQLYSLSIPHALGELNEYAMVLDGAVLKAYKNGVLVASRSDVPPSGTNSADLVILSTPSLGIT